MSSDNDNNGVLRRMVQKVAAPLRDSASSTPAEAGASMFADAEKAELKAMIERKRRNDFVRKRELDMLRRIRREGLSGEQANSLSASSKLDDSEVRPTQVPGGPSPGVKAKIDAIEKQMVGTGGSGAPRAMPPQAPRAAPAPVAAAAAAQPKRGAPIPLPAALVAKILPTTQNSSLDAPSTMPVATGVTRPMSYVQEHVPTQVMADMPSDPPVLRAVATSLNPVPSHGLPPPTDLGAIEVSEIVHDHELDEAVIAFANADFALCERALVHLTSKGSLRHDHSDSWLVLFDLFRATGQLDRYEALATAYVDHFQRSAPQWFSLPKLVADATIQQAPRNQQSTEVAWLCPAHLDVDGITHLNSQTLQLPLPWGLDWTRLERLDPDAASRLYRLMQGWSQQKLEMRWLSADRLFTVLQESAPVGVKDADPAYWMCRLEALRLVNRPDQFDEVAIDYCVTYEVSPPSWAPSRCTARTASASAHTQSAPLSVLSDATTTTTRASPDGAGGFSVTSLELSGQLSGDITGLLTTLDKRLGAAQAVRISCALLIRVDFIAAGDLLNWVLGKRAERRWVYFTDVHRLVALMFGAMGISEHAQVQLRQA